jgi:hypothetical protein
MRTLALCAALIAAPLSAAVLPTLALAASPATDASLAEATLRQTITDFQAGAPRYDTMSPDLAAAVKAQEAGMAQLTPLGPVAKVERQGDGAAPFVFAVTFQAGVALTWTISLDEAGKITGLTVVGG